MLFQCTLRLMFCIVEFTHLLYFPLFMSVFVFNISNKKYHEIDFSVFVICMNCLHKG